MTNTTFEFISGSCPIFISMPHNGIGIPTDIEQNMQTSAKGVVDTDWYLDKLYRFAIEQGCYLIKPKYSRYVIDLNRPKNNENLYPGQDTTELCPTTQFDKSSIYLDEKQPSFAEIETRVGKYWQPYHSQLEQTIAQIKDRFGCVLLFEAHSIKSVVPRFFEGQLADFNFGNNNGVSCSPALIDKIEQWSPKHYSKVVNGRFKGGYITRAYGNPAQNIHSLQLELSQATYMDEEELRYNSEKSEKVKEALNELFEHLHQFIDEQR